MYSTAVRLGASVQGIICNGNTIKPVIVDTLIQGTLRIGSDDTVELIVLMMKENNRKKYAILITSNACVIQISAFRCNAF